MEYALGKSTHIINLLKEGWKGVKICAEENDKLP